MFAVDYRGDCHARSRVEGKLRKLLLGMLTQISSRSSASEFQRRGSQPDWQQRLDGQHRLPGRRHALLAIRPVAAQSDSVKSEPTNYLV